MPIKVEDLEVDRDEIPTEQQQLLTFAFGQPTCTDNGFVRLADILTVPVVATLLFILFYIQPVDEMFRTLLPDYGARLAFKSILFFVLILLLDRMVSSWRDDVEYCQ
jgi:hypothetical protein